MAKVIKNLLNFGGGINTRADKRDIGENESVALDGFLDTNVGTLRVGGAFIRPDSMNNSATGFSGDYVSQGISNLYYINPNIGFTVRNRAVVTKSSNTYTFTCSTYNNHCLSAGTPILCYSTEAPVDDDWNGKYFLVDSVTNKTVFKIQTSDEDAAILSACTVYFATNADYDANAEDHLKVTPKADVRNKYLFRAYNQGRFGFYDIT